MNLPRYEIIRELGHGKSGVTYLAKDKHLPSKRLCAVKQFKPTTNDPKQYELIKERFIEEARHLENLCKHTDQVPELYEFYISDEDGSEIYLIEQWIDGKTVAQRLKEKEPITASEVRDIVTSLLVVLQTLRNEGIIHRDIKPENIILRAADGKPILIDFGVVKEVESTYADAYGSPITPSIVAGTEGYMAPEQLFGRPVFASDLYSVGMTAIHLLTRWHPIDLQKSEGEITWREYAPTISDEFAAVINKSIERNHLHRYANAADMLAALKVCPESKRGSVQLKPSDNSQISRFSISEDSTLLLPTTSLSVVEAEAHQQAPEAAVDLAIEIGNEQTRIFRKGLGVVLSEPTVVAVNRVAGNIEAIGRRAEELFSVTQNEIAIRHPIKDCKVQHRRLTTKMLADFFARARVFAPHHVTRVVMPITSQLSQVNRNALIEVALDAGATEVYLVDAATCAAMGAGGQTNNTSLIVHVGESATEVMVISSGRRVLLRAVRAGTDNMHDSIIQYFRRRHNLLISAKAAQAIWTVIGSAYLLSEPVSREVVGRHLIEGIPRTITVTDDEVREALSDSISIIVNTVRSALERTPPELSADIIEQGIVLTGGGALLKNLDKRLSIETGLPVSLADNPEVSMLAGASRILSDFNLMPDGVRPGPIVKITQAVLTEARRLYRELVSPFSRSLAVDLGTANTIIYAKGLGIVVSEPSIVAVDISSNRIIASGRKVREMGLGNSKIVRPIRDGFIEDPEMASILLKAFLFQARKWSASRPQIVASVPADLTQVEREAFMKVCFEAGAGNVVIVEKSLSAAIGAGVSVANQYGIMLVDIGAGTVSICVMSLGRIIYSRKVLVAGLLMDESIIQYLKRKYNLLIGERTAEAIKIELGSAYPLEEPLALEVRGRNLIEGVPKTVTITDEEVREALSECVSTIINAVRVALERTPPEVAADILDRGILLTGGGALLKNVDRRLSLETGLPVTLAEDPLASTVLGSGKMLSDPELLERSILRDEFL